MKNEQTLKTRQFVSFIITMGLLISLCDLPWAETSTLSSPHTQISNKPNFNIGEKFVFSISYQFMTAGEATLEVEPGVPVDQQETLNFVSTAKSVGFVDTFYRVRDFNKSVVLADSLHSLGLHQNLHEGHFKVIRNTEINYSSGTWVYERQYKGKTHIRNGTIEKGVSDILSSFYQTRLLPLELGQTYYIDVFSGGEVYALRIVVGPKFEKIHVPAGKFTCFRVQPFVQGDSIFKGKDGKLTVYLTNDERRLPVLMQTKVFIGSVNAELVQYRASRDAELMGGK